MATQQLAKVLAELVISESRAERSKLAEKVLKCVKELVMDAINESYASVDKIIKERT